MTATSFILYLSVCLRFSKSGSETVKEQTQMSCIWTAALSLFGMFGGGKWIDLNLNTL